VGRCKTGTVQSVTGECTANIRKGKTIFYYELEVKLPWEGMERKLNEGRKLILREAKN
jgi:hypothetical protein